MHADDARLELSIRTMRKAINSLPFDELANDTDAGTNSPSIFVPLAYAMFSILVDSDIGGDYFGVNYNNWHQFLREALEETIDQLG